MSDDDTISSDLKEKIDDFFINFENVNDLKNITNTSTDDEIKAFIKEVYNKILDRDPDVGGMSHYTNMIKYGAITRDKIIDILKNSDEYKDKINNTSTEQDLSSVNMTIKVSSNENVSNEEEPYITYCMMGTNRLHEIKYYIPEAIKYVDKMIFVDGGSDDGTIEFLTNLNQENDDKILILECLWEDKFSGQRNNYLNKLKDINYNGYVLVSDTDEHFMLSTLKNLRHLIKEIKNSGYNGLKFQVVDVTIDDNDSNVTISENINLYWKSLMFKYHPDLRYEGEPHETLVGAPINWLTLDDSSKCRYKHTRSRRKVLERSVENFFISNSNRYSEKWADFRFLCTKNDILTFKEFFSKFKESSLPDDIEKWIIEHKDDNENSGDSEVREMHELYYKISEDINKSNEKIKDEVHTPIIYCMIGLDRLHEIKPYIEQLLPYVDKFIFIDGGSKDGTFEYLESLKNTDIGKNKVEIYTHPWNDKFDEQRNIYLKILEDKNYNGWIIVSDTDERFTEEALKHLQTIISESENGTKYNGVRFQVEDVRVEDDDYDSVIKRHVNTFWKPLMFKFNNDIYYEGSPHENIIGSPSEPLEWINVGYLYEHIRSRKKICESAVRNFFISNSGRKSEKWKDFREICSKYDLNIFKDFFNEFKKGGLHLEVYSWIEDHKNDNDNIDDREIRQMAILYKEILDVNNKILCKDYITNTQNKFYFTREQCEHCGSVNDLIRYEINDNCCVLMCKICWLSLVDNINKKFGDN